MTLLTATIAIMQRDNAMKMIEKLTKQRDAALLMLGDIISDDCKTTHEEIFDFTAQFKIQESREPEDSGK